jgi:hypothetical protein
MTGLNGEIPFSADYVHVVTMQVHGLLQEPGRRGGGFSDNDGALWG